MTEIQKLWFWILAFVLIFILPFFLVEMFDSEDAWFWGFVIGIGLTIFIYRKFIRPSEKLMEEEEQRLKVAQEQERKKREEQMVQIRKERERQQQLKGEQRKKQEWKSFLDKHKNLIDKFLEITERKVSIIDEYGDENWDTLPEEIDYLIYKIAREENYSKEKIKDWKKYVWTKPEKYRRLEDYLETRFKLYHTAQKKKSSEEIDYDKMTGKEFENYIAKLLREKGYTDVRGTPATGDQGADLIAKKDNKTIIIQAKRHQGKIGNKAVQEIIGALSFYRGDEGWVITNSTFTLSAKALAQKSNIKLIDGQSLNRIGEFL